MTALEEEWMPADPLDPRAVELHPDPEPNPLVEQLEAATYVSDDITRLPPAEPLVDGILDLDTLAALFGPSGEGKSFVAVDLAQCITTGTWWHGHAVTTGPVVYIAAEGGRGIGQRVAAWKQHEGITDLGRFQPVHWLTRAVNLFDPGWTAALVEYVEARKPVLVVIDTLARSMIGAEENSAKDVGNVIANADQLRRATGACILLVHHSGKSLENGARGSSALKAALDTEIECTAADAAITVRVSKVKDHAKPAPVRLQRIPVGPSCVLIPAGQVADDGTLTAKQYEVLDALAAIDVPGGIAPTIWLRSSGIADRTFWRAVARLLELGHITNLGTDDRPRYRTTTRKEQDT